MSAPANIAVIDSVTATDLAQLAEVLVDCVAGGASVSFMPPFEHEDGKAFFTTVAGEVARIYVENGQPVEYGESLFAIRPSHKKSS